MKKLAILLTACLPVCVLAWCAPGLAAQNSPAAASQPAATMSPDANAAKARALLNQMVQALGGQRWLSVQNRYVAGRIAAFYQGRPTGDNVQYWQWSTAQATRIDLSDKSHDKIRWVQIYRNGQCREITWQGNKPMLPKVCAAFNRMHNHSVESAVAWMKDPGTLLLYEGQKLVETHLADQVTLLNDRNDGLTLRLDVQTHLPLSCSWTWRDPVYHDKDNEVEEFADYHPIDGLPTPFSISFIRNGELTQQRFLFNAGYNVPLPPDGFDLNALTAKIVRH